jgi:hypothetical protein
MSAYYLEQISSLNDYDRFPKVSEADLTVKTRLQKHSFSSHSSDKPKAILTR